MSTYFLRPKQNGEDRFILNLKGLNTFINPPHFKLEDLKTAIGLMTDHCFMTSIELKDGYLHIPIDKKHKQFLRFEFLGTIYEFQCMPFGLCTAPFVFTKLLRPVVKKLRENGIVLVIYLDDILIIGKTEKECAHSTQSATKILESLGLVINGEKSNLKPSKKRQFLGFLLDSENMTIQFPEIKVKSISKLITDFQKKEKCKIKEYAKIIGTLVATCPVIKYGWLYTKMLEREKF